MATLNTPELATPAGLASWRETVAARLGVVARSEAFLVSALTGVAALLRLIELTGIPGGLHGDEAVAGLEAQRVLHDGSIGLYSRLAAGQPTGPLYLDALSVKLFGNTALAVRLVPALLGTLTIPLLYVVVRRSLGRQLAALAALLFAVMQWHIHFARIGFPLEAWPLVAVAATGACSKRSVRATGTGGSAPGH